MNKDKITKAMALNTKTQVGLTYHNYFTLLLANPPIPFPT